QRTADPGQTASDDDQLRNPGWQVGGFGIRNRELRIRTPNSEPRIPTPEFRTRNKQPGAEAVLQHAARGLPALRRRQQRHLHRAQVALAVAKGDPTAALERIERRRRGGGPQRSEHLPAADRAAEANYLAALLDEGSSCRRLGAGCRGIPASRKTGWGPRPEPPAAALGGARDHVLGKSRRGADPGRADAGHVEKPVATRGRTQNVVAGARDRAQSGE